MSFLILNHQPDLQLDCLIVAFAGWTDAGEGATTAIKFMQRQFQAKKFAEIDPEEFYDFTQTRPHTTRLRNGRRRVRWPANEFSYWEGPSPAKGAMTFLGIEPNLRWRRFARTIVDLAKQHGVTRVIHLGALLDAVPHNREVRLTGYSTDTGLQEKIDEAGIRSSSYQGPTGISSALMEACADQGIDYASLWGHTSHYLQAAPNFRVSYALARTLISLLDLPLDPSELETAANNFDEQVAEAIDKDDQLSTYVKKLEDHYDESAPASEMPDPAELVRDLEQFLKSEQRRRPGGSQS
ncbi:MAG: PAC2 family protein [Dehalococcoidia bacterium]|jgi:proteasome assembly chaperone (PAC2) family protein|nr:PAC2 family protein [Dehalococcoidia bacterium]MDP6226809.1 PAC2 family protein [Dehalococcoidia bacterium]MDP7085410.1 PAC2 family protein [Dehalococcoidia bacterium]MDP7201816.1 PAC2 family protein [Dehalococcoidia bacterium]MDP7511956.1 PAC2 family protein [Dehalococcoidia bacterium]